jgi:hypothetical protein
MEHGTCCQRTIYFIGLLCIGYLMVSLITNNVTIRVTRSLSAGVCKLICRYFSSTAPQRLNAKDMAWLVGFVDGPYGPGPGALGPPGRPSAEVRPSGPPTRGRRSLRGVASLRTEGWFSITKNGIYR